MSDGSKATTWKSFLAGVKERASKATPGPWTLSMSNQTVRTLDPYQCIIKTTEDGVWDSQFIAHSREDIPLLISRIESLEKGLEIVLSHDRVMGYPTGPEWHGIVEKGRQALNASVGEER